MVVEEIKATMTKLSGNDHDAEANMAGLSGDDYEIILVNDASPDDTFDTITKLCQENASIIGINLARNFGQHAALMAGFREADGDIVICLDDDGQTPAAEAGKLVRAIREGADVVYARYDHKRHSGLRNLGSRFNDLMTRVMLGKPKKLYISSYFAAKRFVIEEVKRYEGSYPYVIGLVMRTTKRIVNVDIEHRERLSGVSGYTLGKLLSLWFNGFTAFSIKPLRIATLIGAVSAVAGFAYAIYTIIKRIFIQPPGLVTGFSALISSIMIIGGMMMLMMGLLGEYIGRMYISMNNSPQYVIREKVGAKDEKKQ
jgi:undecaprenyl-phosphate 4-deoxy-4-formamido-L-arabinose transferase